MAKSFGSCCANQDISLSARRGTIHAVIGENGAGKSTAMKMLYGMFQPDSGELWINGKKRTWSSPADAIDAGIGMVHQHFMLAGPYSVLENVLLGTKMPLRRAPACAELAQLAEQYGMGQIPWDEPVESLPVGVQQRIEIIKLLYQKASVLILDEPTAVLTPQETSDLFLQLRKMAQSPEPKTILIITHKLKEVMALADDVTVFRAGKVVGTRKTADTTPDELASLMVGRRVKLGGDFSIHTESLTLGKSVLELKTSDLHLNVRSGEIVGIAGVEGNGQSALIQSVLAQPHVRAQGFGIIPEDRHREGLLLDRSLEENFVLGREERPQFSKWGWLLSEKIKAAVEHALEKYDVRPRNRSALARSLSGGNQQKLIVAREFQESPKFLLAAQPTRGVDVGAIEYIHQQILDARAGGAGVLLVSSELDEILTLSDRILVMFKGKFVAEYQRGQATEQDLGLKMGGHFHEGA